MHSQWGFGFNIGILEEQNSVHQNIIHKYSKHGYLESYLNPQDKGGWQEACITCCSLRKSPCIQALIITAKNSVSESRSGIQIYDAFTSMKILFRICGMHLRGSVTPPLEIEKHQYPGSSEDNTGSY